MKSEYIVESWIDEIDDVESFLDELIEVNEMSLGKSPLLDDFVSSLSYTHAQLLSTKQLFEEYSSNMVNLNASDLLCYSNLTKISRKARKISSNYRFDICSSANNEFCKEKVLAEAA